MLLAPAPLLNRRLGGGGGCGVTCGSQPAAAARVANEAGARVMTAVRPGTVSAGLAINYPAEPMAATLSPAGNLRCSSNPIPKAPYIAFQNGAPAMNEAYHKKTH
jgi:hypothetical protein